MALRAAAHVAWSRTCVAIAISAALGSAPIFPAWAVTDQQISWCNGGDNASPELSISGCTAMIQSGEYIGDDLAIVFNNRGIAYFKSGQSEKAVQDYDQALSLSPNFFNALSGRCWNRAIVGRDLGGAIADCNRALALNPSISYTRGSRGFAYLKMSDYSAAIADFDAALKAHPENAPSLYGRGLAKRAKGDASGASADMTAAGRLDPLIAQKFLSWGVASEQQSTKTATLGSSAPATATPSGDQGGASASPTDSRSSTSAPEAVVSTPPQGLNITSPTVSAATSVPSIPASVPSEPQSAAPAPHPSGAAQTGSAIASSAANGGSAQQAAVIPPAESSVPPPVAGATAISAPPRGAAAAVPQQGASGLLSSSAIEALVKRGDELLSTGDVVAARSAYERAASSGSGAAATGVAKTYDPVFLAQSGVRGLRGDPAQAASWYGKAVAAGDREAQERLNRLRAQFPQRQPREGER